MNHSASKRRVLAFDSQEGLYRAAAQRIIELAGSAIKVQNQFSIALGGGNTPKRLHQILATEFANALDWSRVRFFWGDERAVPPTHGDSNFGMAAATLLQPLGIGAEQIYRMEGERTDLDQAAWDYERHLRETLSLDEDGRPILDLVLLGMGADAHTASLFPHTSAIDEQHRLVVATHVAQVGAARLTMTLPLLNAARTVMFVVMGEGKAEALAHVLEGPTDIQNWPSQGVVVAGTVEWWIDADAASQLERHAI